MTATEELIDRARALRAELRAHQSDAERLGVHPERIHDRLRAAGLYRLLVPRRLGGEGVDLDTFLRVVGELACGCPLSAWSFAALAGGALRARGVVDAAPYAELLADPEFRCAPAGGGNVRAAREGERWSLEGALPCSAGARYATHAVGVAQVGGAADPPARLDFIAPRSSFELREHDDGRVEIRFEAASIPGRLTRARGAADGAASRSPADLWETAVLPAALAAVYGGAARAAVESYEGIVRTGSVPGAPDEPLLLDGDHQRRLGAALGRADAAGLLLDEAAAPARGLALGEPAALASTGERLLLGMLARESIAYAWGAVTEVLRTPVAAGERELDRTARTLLRAAGEPLLAPEESAARRLARHRLGLPLDV